MKAVKLKIVWRPRPARERLYRRLEFFIYRAIFIHRMALQLERTQ
jgi:hypothetical protein